MFALSFATSQEASRSGAVYLTFDESPQRLQGYIDRWTQKSKITFIDVRPDPEAVISGRHIELSPLFIRIENAIKKSGAKYLIIDAIDTLFEAFEHKSTVHLGLARVFDWCRQAGITLLATAGESENYRTGTGILDYACDCAIRLSQDMNDGLMSRSIRVLKNRGNGHGTNSYPYIIDADGISLIPITSTQMSAKAPKKHLSMGNKTLDQMLGGKGVWRGSTVMVSGQSGTGKSLLSARVAESACQAGLKVLYFSFEESPDQFVRDVASAGLRLREFIKSGALTIKSERPVERGLEEHIIRISRLVEANEPDVVVFDPISAIGDMGNAQAFKNVVIRLCHHMKSMGVTVIMTELLPDFADNYSTLNISSLVDSWVRLRRVENDGKLCRQIYVHKSRGMKTSNRIANFEITTKGLEIDLNQNE